MFDLTGTLLGVLPSGPHVDDGSAVKVEPVDDTASRSKTVRVTARGFTA
jgi:hypothetical protein